MELDGGHHNEPVQSEHDATRDAVLWRAGYQVMRFPHAAVRGDIDGVMDAIVLALEARPSTRGESSG
ncbi:DUF559 domain-containing protein [Phenylobacterium sp.]|uniref:endonuclease domain-containing protein n=1 Tax=Phenylobacterium sp. TaxID=1871053 RepID=UPI0025FAF4E8|nr:DUF559 domain-containing protein [Phenylobacterium sp.]